MQFENIKKNFSYSSYNFFFYLILSLVISLLLSSSIDQRSVNSGLYLSNKINLFDTSNLLNLVYTNSYTTIYQISEIILRFGLSTYFLNFFLLFLSLFFNSYGIFLIVKSITKNYFLSLTTSLLAIVTTLNFGDLDYPVLVLSEHTNGMLGSSLVVFIFGLVGNKNYKLALLFCFICLTFHLVIGVWISLVTLITFYFFNKIILFSYFKDKKNILYLFVILFVFLISVLYFQFSKTDILYEFDATLFKTYMLAWEHHRNFAIKINFFYIFLSTLLFFSVFFSLKFKKEKLNPETVIMLKFLLVHLILSFLIYISFKLFPGLFNEKLIQIMPSRFFLLHSFFGLYILISLILLYILEIDKIKRLLILFLSIVYLIPSFLYFEKSPILNNLYKKIIVKKENYDQQFWKNLKLQKFKNGYLLSSTNICTKTLKEIRQPLLICIESIDYLNYVPNLIKPVSEIIIDVYEIDFSNPPEKNHGGLWYDSSYKKVFEDRSIEKWINISKKYNLNGLILPSSWKLNLDKTLVGKNYTYYRL
tara:strand:+ start:85 stop:1683 length:1599 start_codon:yes stop_codon:yes gene_type:complete